MSETVEVPFGKSVANTAILLLAAAEDLGLDPAMAVRTISGHFVVPREVADHVESLNEDDTSGSVTDLGDDALPIDSDVSDPTDPVVEGHDGSDVGDSDDAETEKVTAETKDEKTTKAPAEGEKVAPAKKAPAKKAVAAKDKE